MHPDSRPHHLLLLLLLVVVVAAAADAASADWPERLERTMRNLRDDINARLQEDVRQLRQRVQRPVVADMQVELADRASRHVFRVHDDGLFAADAMQVVSRVYRVSEGPLFSQVCTCRGDGRGQACARHYKPAFYALAAVGGLLAVLFVTLGVAAIARWRSGARSGRPLLRRLVSGRASGGLSVQCDSLTAAAVYGKNQEILKIPV